MKRIYLVTAIINHAHTIHFFVTIDAINPPKNLDNFIREKASEVIDDIYDPINTISYTLQQVI